MTTDPLTQVTPLVTQVLTQVDVSDRQRSDQIGNSALTQVDTGQMELSFYLSDTPFSLPHLTLERDR
jgi:hypothetical protein